MKPQFASTWLRGILFFCVSLVAVRGQGPADAPVSTIVTVAGTVEVARGGTTNWMPAATNLVLQVGDLVRTGERSRATLRLTDRSLLPLDELTVLQIEPPQAGATAPTLNLRQGAVYLFSRERPRQIELRTRRARAAIRGTEFHARANESGDLELTLIDGAVELSGDNGRVTLEAGEQGNIGGSLAPTRTAVLEAINVIQWALYYPAILDLDELTFSADTQTALRASLAAYRAGELLAALRLFPAGRRPADGEEQIYLAALLLAVGQVDDSQALLASSGTAGAPGRNERLAALGGALKLLVAAVKFQRVEGLPALARSATATELLARSWYEQAQGRLSEARRAAEYAAERAPGFSFAWARLAEMQFSFGDNRGARASIDQALAIGPQNAQAWTISGFLEAAGNRIGRAFDHFDRSIGIDPNLGNGWLGRGLCRIRQGDLAAGVRDLEVAAAVEPNRALLRNYLGKAFVEQNDLAHATRELELARKFDPQEPTSWLYSALLNRDRNRINEAVRELERSRALNDNRALFRSRLLLDQDRAVRGANLASIYRDAGMIDVSVREASRAVQSDYANASAHLFLAHSYNELRDPRQVNLRYESATFAELLLANLLGPVGGTPLSQNISQHEYQRLFEGDHLGLSSSTDYFSSGDWHQAASQYGRFHNTAYALDVVHRSQNGWRPNEDFSEQTFHAVMQQQLSARDTIYLHGIYYQSDAGDLSQYYDPANAHRQLRQHEVQKPLLLLGYHREWSPGNHTLALAGRLRDTLEVTDPAFATLGLTDFGSAPIGFDLEYRSDLLIYTAELQQIWQSGDHTVVLGGRYQSGGFDVNSQLSEPSVLPFAFGDPAVGQDALSPSFERLGLYGYHSWQITPALQVNGGLAWDGLEYPRNYRNPPLDSGEATRYRLSPKAGIIWTPGADTTLRAAYTRSLGGVSLEQSIRLEPTQVGGFNQAYRSLVPESIVGSVAAPELRTAGMAVDQKFSTGTYVGVAAEHLTSEVERELGAFAIDFVPPSASRQLVRQRLDFRENNLTAHLHQLAGKEWAAGARYRFSDVALDNAPVGLGTTRLEGTLQQLQAYALFNHSSGLFARADSLWLSQSNRGFTPDQPGDEFWQFNVYVGYRWHRRRAEVRAGLLNLTDQDYRLNPLNFYLELPRERTFMASLRFNF